MNNNEILSPPQIELLYDYCKSERVKYYDIQQELVDHMSVWIENKMAINGSNFRIAFTDLAQEFPGSELRKIAAFKAASIRKEAAKRLLSELRSFLKWPKLLIPIGLYVLFFLLLTKINPTIILGFLISRMFYYYLFKINVKANIVLRNRKECTRPLLVMREVALFQFISSISLTLIGFLCVENFSVASLTGNRTTFIAFYTLFELALFCVQQVSVDLNVQIRRKFPLAFVAK